MGLKKDFIGLCRGRPACLPAESAPLELKALQRLLHLLRPLISAFDFKQHTRPASGKVDAASCRIKNSKVDAASCRIKNYKVNTASCRIKNYKVNTASCRIQNSKATRCRFFDCLCIRYLHIQIYSFDSISIHGSSHDSEYI